MEDVVTARARYDLMDNPASPARIRLNSAVVKVRHLGTPSSAKQVEVTYVRGGKVERVSASGVVMACYNMIIPRIVTDLPEAQKEAQPPTRASQRSGAAMQDTHAQAAQSQRIP